MSDTRHTILIVDDEQEIIDVLKEHFKQRNCETIATCDSLTVVDKLRNFQVKLMLLDLKMRQLDGFDVLDKIRQAGLPLPPTIIMTGFFGKYKDKLENHGIAAADVITKPFRFDTIESMINRKLGQQIISDEVGSEYENKIYKNNRCRIAIVEDENDVLKDFQELFEERNYKVFCFNNGSQAFESLKKEPVDVALVDIKLPGMQGDQLIRELGKTSNSPYMIAMSADPLPSEMKVRVNSAGCTEFISKPFDVAEIIERVKTIAVEKGLLG